jgi:F-type H+-transporting ATPase subunit delta
MRELSAATRYARSFLLVAANRGIVEEVEAQLLNLKEAYLAEPKVRAFMTNPRIPIRAKLGAVEKAMSGKVHALTLIFAKILVQRRRFTLIAEIADAFDRMADAYRGVVRIQVHTFGPLKDAQREALHAQVTRLLKGQKIDLQVEEDRSLLGGIWVKVGDTLIDGSISTKLKTLRERLFDVRLA